MVSARNVLSWTRAWSVFLGRGHRVFSVQAKCTYETRGRAGAAYPQERACTDPPPMTIRRARRRSAQERRGKPSRTTGSGLPCLVGKDGAAGARPGREQLHPVRQPGRGQRRQGSPQTRARTDRLVSVKSASPVVAPWLQVWTLADEPLQVALEARVRLFEDGAAFAPALGCARNLCRMLGFALSGRREACLCRHGGGRRGGSTGRSYDPPERRPASTEAGRWRCSPGAVYVPGGGSWLPAHVGSLRLGHACASTRGSAGAAAPRPSARG
jgi:hypothetical protein